MAIRNIIQVGDPTLRKRSFEVTAFDERLNVLLDDMKETLRRAEGAGLAAPQVGVLRRVFVVDVSEGYFEFVNPKLLIQKGKQTGAEGCLSVRGKQGTVTRPNYVKVSAFDRKGNPFVLEAEGFFARAICHEYDHLEGVLYIDKVKDLRDE